MLSLSDFLLYHILFLSDIFISLTIIVLDCCFVCWDVDCDWDDDRADCCWPDPATLLFPILWHAMMGMSVGFCKLSPSLKNSLTFSSVSSPSPCNILVFPRSACYFIQACVLAKIYCIGIPNIRALISIRFSVVNDVRKTQAKFKYHLLLCK